MSSQNLKDEKDYNNSLNSKYSFDSSLNLANNNNDNDNFTEFGKQVFINFIIIFIWGFLGTTCIFWFTQATSNKVKDKIAICYSQENNNEAVSFLDIYFPYNTEKMPYRNPSARTPCTKVNTSQTKVDNSECSGPPKPAVKSTNSNIKFPYSMFLNINSNINKLNEKSPTNAKLIFQKIGLWFKNLYLIAFRESFISPNKNIYKFLKMINTNSLSDGYQNNLNTFGKSLYLLFWGFFIFLLKIIFFCSSLFSPLIAIVKYITFNYPNAETGEGIYYPVLYFSGKLTFKWFEWLKEKFKRDNENEGRDFIFKFLIFLPVLGDILLTLIMLCISFSFIIPAMLVFLIFSLCRTIYLKIFLIIGALKSGSFFKIFNCQIWILIIIFGACITLAANKYLDSKISPFIATSYAIYIIYKIIKFIGS